MTDRFFVPADDFQEFVWLPAEEAQHLAKVMRANIGDEIILFDGRGMEYSGRITQIDKRRAQVEILSREAISRELPGRLVVAVAFPKGDRQKFMLEKLTEIGVHEVIPIICERSVVKMSENGIKRSLRTVVEASKQCGRNRLMEVHSAQSIDEVIRGCTGHRRIASPSANRSSAIGLDVESDTISLLVGPEGGFTDTEIDRAVSQGWTPMSLGARILRIETAAIAAASVFATHLEKRSTAS